MRTGIPVPATIPEGSKAFVLCVPDDPFFYGVVMGALKTMTFKYYWDGTDEEKTAVTDRMLTMYYNYQEQVGCMICDLITECITSENEALIAALADAIANNPLLRDAINAANAENGGSTPGMPITDQQAAQDTLPDNVKNEDGSCKEDELWGAMLYLVQSGNRAITDVFEIIESASNTLENMEIISKNIPAAGDFISAAAGFADQLQEVIAEGYSAAYTEVFEENLACDLFCFARGDCALSVDDLMTVMNNRLTEPIDIGDFGEIMAGTITGTWVGDDIANVAFLIFFAALRFGQQFGGTVGIRPLNILMSLGADQLASDNWEALCDCEIPPECVPTFRIVNPTGLSGGSVDVVDNLDGTWTATGTAAFASGAYRLAFVQDVPGCCWQTISASFTHTPQNIDAQYNCDADPTDEDYGNGLGTGSLTVDLCASGYLGADVDDAFQLTWTFRLCP